MTVEDRITYRVTYRHGRYLVFRRAQKQLVAIVDGDLVPQPFVGSLPDDEAVAVVEAARRRGSVP